VSPEGEAPRVPMRMSSEENNSLSPTAFGAGAPSLPEAAAALAKMRHAPAVKP